MKTMTKRTAVAALTGVMAVGMLTGCGEKKLDGTKTVATVDGTEIPLGIVSLSVREGQAQTEAMYKSFMGGAGLFYLEHGCRRRKDLWRTGSRTVSERCRADVHHERKGCRL